MTLATAPTPCSRMGFHISSSSSCFAGTAGNRAVAWVFASIISMSPGWAASIAAWMLAVGATCVGGLPPIVTVTVSIDCLPLAAVITSSPHCAVEPPYCVCCCTAQFGTPEGTVPVMRRSPQVTPVNGRATPSEPTRATVPVVLPKEYFRVTLFALNGAVVAEGPEYPLLYTGTVPSAEIVSVAPAALTYGPTPVPSTSLIAGVASG